MTGGGCADDQRPKALRFTSRPQREMLKQLLRHLPPKYFGLIQFALGLPSASMEGPGRGFRGNRAQARPGEGQGLWPLLGLCLGIRNPDERRLQWYCQSLLFKNKGGETTGPVLGRRDNMGGVEKVQDQEVEYLGLNTNSVTEMTSSLFPVLQPRASLVTPLGKIIPPASESCCKDPGCARGHSENLKLSALASSHCSSYSCVISRVFVDMIQPRLLRTMMANGFS